MQSILETPIGPRTIVEDDCVLMEIHVGWRTGALACPDRRGACPTQIEKQLCEYFDGTRKTFDLAIRPKGTPFQLAVWRELQTIPYGETRTYADIARAIGRAAAVRAVGAANGANPIPIVIPCHRVIGSNGSLTGFGGGIDMKRALLDFEAGYRTLTSSGR